MQQKIDNNYQMDQLQDSALSKCQDCINFKKMHSLTTAYTFQLKNMQRRKLQYMFSIASTSSQRSFWSISLYHSIYTGFHETAFL